MKKILGIVVCGMSICICAAAEISFSPDTGDMQKGCLVAVDIMIDAEDNKIAATDVVMETSLKFVDFVPSSAFPYFLPVKTQGNMIHIVGFNIDPRYRMTGKEKLGTLYLEQKNFSDTDGHIKLYFKKYGDTTDTNLSIPGGVDVLDRVGSAAYRFVDEGICMHHSADNIKNGIADKTLQMLLAKVDKDELMKRMCNRKTIVSFSGLIIAIILLFIYYSTNTSGRRK